MNGHRAPVLRVDGTPDLVSLTIDDCDDPEAWASILDALGRSEVKATFFSSGMRVEGFPDLARRARDEGHALGSHGYDHARLGAGAALEARANLRRDADAWLAAVGRPPTLFRPPYGSWDPTLIRVASEIGYGLVVLWDVDPEDWRRPTPSEIVDRVLHGVRDGSIVVLHAVPETARAIPSILDGMSELGLDPTTVPRLVAAGAPVRAGMAAASAGTDGESPREWRR